MPVKCEEYNQVCVMTLEGDFTADEVTTARKAAQNLIEDRQIVQFVVDFEKSGFVDSDGLEALLWLKSECEEHFGQVKLAALDENMRKILEITRLEPRFECHDDVTAALKTMR